MNQYKLGIVFLSLVGVWSGCSNGDEFFGEERYKKEIYIMSDDEQIFHAEYEMTEEEDLVKTLAFAVSGTNPIDSDVKIEVEKDENLLLTYNSNVYMDETDKYAREIKDTDYTMASSIVEIKRAQAFKDQVGKLPIALKKSILEKLSVDSTYFIPLRMKSATPYEMNENKNNVLYRVYKKNQYASQRTTTYYNSNGYIGASFFTSTKIVHPLSFSEVRVYVGNQVYTTNDSENTINTYAMIITVNSDKTVTLKPYSTEKDLKIEILPPADDPNDESGSYSYRNYYEPDEKCFYLYYSYAWGDGTPTIVRELMKLE